MTRTLARLLEHLHAEGHEAMVLGPDTGLTKYLGHPVVGTFGIPILVYPGLKLNFARLRFMRRLQQFRPDVVHFVDPIWLGAQMLFIVKQVLPGVPCVSSYHTNLPTYASLFGMPFLEPVMWGLIRSLHLQCDMVFCPSESTRRMLVSKGFRNVEIWSRGVDTDMFTPQARDENLRTGWGCKPKSQALLDTLHDQAVTSSIMPRKNEMDPFIRTPDSLPLCDFSPPPAYESISDLPPLPGAGFTLPPAVVPQINSVLSRLSNEPNLVTDAAGATAINNDSKAVVLFVGRISWEKNIRLLIEAFRLLPVSVRDSAKLVIVGDGPARAELTRLCARYGLDAAFMGHQKGKRLASMYASSSIFAFPSFTETFGQVVLEALASGLPVVGLHAEGTSDLVCHGITGLLLDVQRVLSANTWSSEATQSTQQRHNSLAECLGAHAPQEQPQLSAPSGRAVPVAASSTLKAGLPTPIPSVKEFASALAPSSQSFIQCAQAYSILLERLIRDRTLRATMGQRAQQYASNKTWWDAMDAPVRGYEQVIATAGQTNLSDAELEALRNVQRRTAPLSGPIAQGIVLLYLVMFICLWSILL